MYESIEDLQQQAQTLIEQADAVTVLEQVRVDYMGKNGALTRQLRDLGQLPKEERPKVGQAVNAIKRDLEARIQSKSKQLQELQLDQQLNQEAIDVTLPARGYGLGGAHLVSKTIARIEDYFSRLGFTMASGPEVEDDFHNFKALNIPESHPARASQDTFYFNPDRMLRTQTSGVQIRVMENQKPPFQIIASGRVYRSDSDITHTPMFHQIEGLWVDEHIHFSNLKAVLSDFLCHFFEKELKVRFRPSYFPFTEPSAEVDVTCTMCGGKGCRICKNTGFLEVLGSGMVHPNVLKAVGLDPNVYQGFAFGLGVERLAMLRYGVHDLRHFFENDWRFLKQFKG